MKLNWRQGPKLTHRKFRTDMVAASFSSFWNIHSTTCQENCVQIQIDLRPWKFFVRTQFSLQRDRVYWWWVNFFLSRLQVQAPHWATDGSRPALTRVTHFLSDFQCHIQEPNVPCTCTSARAYVMVGTWAQLIPLGPWAWTSTWALCYPVWGSPWDMIAGLQ